MSANIAKIAKVTRSILIPLVTSVCLVLKTPLRNIAKSIRITNLTRFTTLETEEEPKRGPEMSANVAKYHWWTYCVMNL